MFKIFLDPVVLLYSKIVILYYYLVLFFAIMLVVSLASKIRSLKKKSIKTRDIFELLSTDERAIALTYYRVLKIRSIIPILVS